MAHLLDPLTLTAVTIAFFHTLFGPDHYVPFVAMSRVGRWSLAKTTIITILCGIGHVGSSAVLGLIGVFLGVAVFKLKAIETFRGDVAGWLLLAFGVGYTAWGLRAAYRNRPHTHWHSHGDGVVHAHEHTHHAEHVHVHEPEPAGPESPASTAKVMTPWILFTVFVFGPCEPLIPIVMYPAAQGSLWRVFTVTLAFGIVTIATMLTVVLAFCMGLASTPLDKLQRFNHAAAGMAILACGVAVKCGM